MPGPADYRTWSHGRAHRLRLPHYPAGYPVHVTLGSWHGGAYFRSEELARAVFARICADSDTLATTVMPDHVHWLIADASDIVSRVSRFKSTTTRRAWELGLRGRIWQKSFFDSLIRDRSTLLEVVRYVVANPLRAGLVESPEDYPWTRVFRDRLPIDLDA